MGFHALQTLWTFFVLWSRIYAMPAVPRMIENTAQGARNVDINSVVAKDIARLDISSDVPVTLPDDSSIRATLQISHRGDPKIQPELARIFEKGHTGAVKALSGSGVFKSSSHSHQVPEFIAREGPGNAKNGVSSNKSAGTQDVKGFKEDMQNKDALVVSKSSQDAQGLEGLPKKRVTFKDPLVRVPEKLKTDDPDFLPPWISEQIKKSRQVRRAHGEYVAAKNRATRAHSEAMRRALLFQAQKEGTSYSQVLFKNHHDATVGALRSDFHYDHAKSVVEEKLMKGPRNLLSQGKLKDDGLRKAIQDDDKRASELTKAKLVMEIKAGLSKLASEGNIPIERAEIWSKIREKLHWLIRALKNP